MTSAYYQRRYAADPVWRAALLRRNRAWNKSERGREWKRAYMARYNRECRALCRAVDERIKKT